MVAVANGSKHNSISQNDGATFDNATLPASASYSRVQIGGASDNVVMATATGVSDIYVGPLTTDGDPNYCNRKLDNKSIRNR